MDVKRCTGCQETKPVSAFTRRLNRPNSPYVSRCKPCLAKYKRDGLAGATRDAFLVAQASGERCCTGCGLMKPIDQFPVRRDGAPNATHRAQCKACHYAKTQTRYKAQLRIAQDAWRNRNRAQVNAQAKARGQVNPQVKAITWKRWAKKNVPSLNERSRRRDAGKRQATPAWADRDAMRDIYEIATMLTRMTGVPHCVDHMVPLKSDIVCGLHVQDNLMVMTKSENSRKKNYFWQDMP